jgi:hypothetical protein
MLQRLRAKPRTPKGSKSELDDLESAVDMGEDGRNAHSWVVAGGDAYDILFGTTGAAVLGFVAGEYTLDPHDKNKFVKVSGTGPDRIKGGQGKADANQHGFTPAYGPA